MSAYRYWRLLLTSQPRSDYVGLVEIELHTSIGGADVTGSGTASARSENLGWGEASMAFDNNSGTQWFSYANTILSWIQYDFGAGVAHAVVEYVMRGYSDPSYSPTAWLLLASHDSQHFTAIDVKTGQSWTAGETKTFAVDIPLVAGTPFRPSVATVIDASHYWIHSTVDRLGVPGRYPVRLYNRASGALLKESKSDIVSGAYQFQFLPYLERGYQVIALDDPATRSDPKNAAIADLMTPEAMP